MPTRRPWRWRRGGREVGSLGLEGLGSDVDGRLVRAMGGGAQPERGGGGRTLLRIQITAEVDGVRHRQGGRPRRQGGRRRRFAALIRALMGRKPKVYGKKDGEMVIKCYGELDGFTRYAESQRP